MKKEKVKEFYQKHKKAITNFAWMAIGVAAGACTMNAVSNHRGIFVTNENVKKILVDSTKELGAGKMAVFTAEHANGVCANQLGELGDVITTCGGQDNVFKYFIAIGPNKE